jgi:antitoxin VapB
MNTAKLFTNGRSQAVRLPKAFRFDADEIFIRRIGDAVVLLPKTGGFSGLLRASGQFTDDFMDGRDQPVDAEHRESL